LPREIEEGGKNALGLLKAAFHQMDVEEGIQRADPNSSKKCLTSVQRNRMAINYLHMNEAPRKYRYFDRFIDKAHYEDMRTKIISGKAKEEKAVNRLQHIHSQLLEIKKTRKQLKKEKKKQRDEASPATLTFAPNKSTLNNMESLHRLDVEFSSIGKVTPSMDNYDYPQLNG
jgi:hypothetical protein